MGVWMSVWVDGWVGGWMFVCLLYLIGKFCVFDVQYVLFLIILYFILFLS